MDRKKAYALIIVSSLWACATASTTDDTAMPDASDHDVATQKDATADSAAHDATSPFADGATNDAVADAGISDAGGNEDVANDVESDVQTIPDAQADVVTTCPTPYTGTLATWDFTGELGNQASTAATSTAQGITAGAVSRSTNLTAVSGTNSINSSNWSTSNSVDATRYYTFTITPAANCHLDLTSVSIDSTASKTGPADGAVATSDDSFASATTFTPGAVTSVSLSVSGDSAALEIRVYGYAASGTAGTMRIQNTLTVSGTLN